MQTYDQEFFLLANVNALIPAATEIFKESASLTFTPTEWL